jgi:hypothetical protein
MKKYNRNTFYGGKDRGYIDYSFYKQYRQYILYSYTFT